MTLIDNGKSLIEKVHQRGWNLYDSTDISIEKGYEAIKSGAVNQRHPLTGFRIFKNSIKINTPIGHFLNYKGAVEVVSTLFDAKQLSYQ